MAAQPQLLKGKACAITGGVSGIGRAIALDFVRHGADVIVNHLGDEWSQTNFQTLLDEKPEGGRLLGVEGDISKPNTAKTIVERCVAEFGKLDVFVSNAGVCEFAEFLDVEADHLDFTVSINLSGAFHAVQSAARQMVKQGHGGSIIGVSSISALVGGAQQTHYTPTKAGVLSLMQSCACALGKYGIRCNALLPGTIRTRLNEEDLADDVKRTYMEGRIPLGRTGVPGDLAGPAVFLASELSGYVTGAQLLVDGGLFVNLQ